MAENWNMAENSEEIEELKLIRFNDLVDAGIVTNRPTVHLFGGLRLSPNSDIFQLSIERDRRT